jgi:acetyl-CoA C-acetyltransferase
MTDAYIFDAVRTPRGKGTQSGKLHEVRAIDLLTDALRELQRRNKLDTAQVDDGIFVALDWRR